MHLRNRISKMSDGLNLMSRLEEVYEVKVNFKVFDNPCEYYSVAVVMQ
jgi:hypothetical protein